MEILKFFLALDAPTQRSLLQIALHIAQMAFQHFRLRQGR